MSNANLEVHIDWFTWQKCIHMMGKAENDEWSLLANCWFNEDGTVINVGESYVPKQNNRPSETEMTDEGIAEAMFKLKDHEGDTAHCWLHSHVNMAVSPSGTDDDTILKLADGGWSLGIIINKKYETRAFLQMCKPFRMKADHLAVKICRPPIDEKTIKSWDKEFDDNVEKWTNSYYGGRGGTYWGKTKATSTPKTTKTGTSSTSQAGGAKKENAEFLDNMDKVRQLVGGVAHLPATNQMSKKERELWKDGDSYQKTQLVELCTFRTHLKYRQIARAVNNIKNGKEWYDGIDGILDLVAD